MRRSKRSAHRHALARFLLLRTYDALLSACCTQVLWHAVERVIPDIRERAEVTMVGTPLTHERYLRRHRGSYGPGLVAGEGTLPGCVTAIPGLYACGDSVFPGIGLPAVAASGAIAANTILPVWNQLDMLRKLGI